MAAKYGCDIDFPGTFPVVERHGRRSEMSASSPEELETPLTDAVSLCDHAAVLSLFEADAFLITGPRITGSEQALAELASLGYVAATRTVTGHREVAVIVGDHAVNVSRRGSEGFWRLVATIVRPGRHKT